MPYIPQTVRHALIEGRGAPCTPGELNFLFTRAIVQYYERSPVNYRTINDVLGALEGAKLEFYRRVAVPYEDQKREENGDVYPLR